MKTRRAFGSDLVSGIGGEWKPTGPVTYEAGAMRVVLTGQQYQDACSYDTSKVCKYDASTYAACMRVATPSDRCGWHHVAVQYNAVGRM